MALGAYAICSLTEAKNFLGFKDEYTDLDSYIESLIDAASLAIEARIENKVADQTVSDEILSGTGEDILKPRYSPIVSVTTLQYRTAPDEDWQTLESTAAYILVDPLWDYIMLYDTMFPVGTRNIRMTYVAGYETIPGDLWLVCIEKVADMFLQSKKGGGRFGITSTTNQGQSTSYKDFTVEHERILRRYAKKTNSLSAYR